MKKTLPKWLRPVLFLLGGMLAGYLYYRFVGCVSGTCPISSNPIRSMLYLGVVGLLLSGVFGKSNCCKKNDCCKR